MAILPLAPGISAQVLINNRPAQEIEDPDELPSPHLDPTIAAYHLGRTVSSYIECQSNSPFSILLSVGPPIRTKFPGLKRMKYTKIGFEIEIDGNKVWSEKCTRPWFNRNPREKRWESVVKGVKIGKGKGCRLREFRFLKVETNSESVDKAHIERMHRRMQKVGKIEIKVYAENYGKKGGDAEDTTGDFLDEEEDEVPEKALKGDAKDHGTVLDEAKKVARGEFWRTEKVDTEDYPLAIFRFLYRSEEALKKMLVIPRTPSPSPSSSPSPTHSPEPESEEEEEEEEDDLTKHFTPAQVRILMRREKLRLSHAGSSSSGSSRKTAASGSSKKGPTPGGKTLGGRVMKVKKEKFSELRSTQMAVQRHERGGKPEVINLISDDEDKDDAEGGLFFR